MRTPRLGSRPSLWMVAALAALTACTSGPVMCSASCAVPVRADILGMPAAPGLAVQVCLDGVGCATARVAPAPTPTPAPTQTPGPTQSAASGPPVSGAVTTIGRPACATDSPHVGCTAFGPERLLVVHWFDLSPAALGGRRITVTVLANPTDPGSVRSTAASTFTYHRDDGPCSCPNASATIRPHG